MTEAGIDAGFTRDLFVALGEPLDGGTAWSVRIQTKPFIRWIWLGTIFMALGGLLAACDRRYRRVGVTVRASNPAIAKHADNTRLGQKPSLASISFAGAVPTKKTPSG